MLVLLRGRVCCGLVELLLNYSLRRVLLLLVVPVKWGWLILLLLHLLHHLAE